MSLAKLKQLEKTVGRIEHDKANKGAPVKSTWQPLPDPPGRIHPQKWAIQRWKEGADEIFYGGAAGGGKSGLAVGMALTEHYASLILRQEGSQLVDIIGQLKDFAPPGSHWRGIGNGGKMTTSDGRTVELAGVPHEDDKRRFQGRAHSIKIFDECTEIPESVIDYVGAWTRTTRPGQKTLNLLLGNPPTHADGAWIVRRYAPWLDPSHPNPAKPGDLRHFVRVGAEEREVPDKKPVEFRGKIITPQTRTFIPARLDDNPRINPEYASRLALLPPGIRDALLLGDFGVCLMDDPWAVIPSSWIRMAQQRWKADPPAPLTACGFDIAMGGADKTVLAKRHGDWVAPLQTWQGEATDDPKKAAMLIVPQLAGFRGKVNCDVIGWGSGCVPILKDHGVNAVGISFAKSAGEETDVSRTLRFSNLRALCYWRLRERLDPSAGSEVALPPEEVSPGLLAELAAPRYEWRGQRLFIRPKDEIKETLGRSPDLADAVALAFYEPPRTPFYFGG